MTLGVCVMTEFESSFTSSDDDVKSMTIKTLQISLSLSFCDVCMCVLVEVVEEITEIEGTFTSSDDVVKSKPSQTATSGENLYTLVHVLLQSVILCMCS